MCIRARIGSVRHCSAFLIVSLLLASAVPAAAQEAPPRVTPVDAPRLETETSFASLFTGIGRDLWRLPSKQTLVTLGIGGALALAAMPADKSLTTRVSASAPLDRVFEVGSPAGNGLTQIATAAGSYLIGRATGHAKLQAIGADLIRAQGVNAVLTQGLKVSVGRRRPNGGRYSLPSGHASASFATATVLQRHAGWKAGVPAYGLAAYIAASRLQENRHYASDVIFGAALGITAGRTVTIGRGAQRFAIAPMPTASGGIAVMITHTPQR
jgi:membrane-associated phospholipid phosphatase